VQALEKSRYDIVFMDCQMPEMDGYQATGEIRNPNSKVIDHKVPVIALTAHATQGARAKCLDAGMDDYMTKPFNPDQLADMLAKWLPEQPFYHQDKSFLPEMDQPGEKILNWTGFLDRILGDKVLAKEIFNEFLDETAKRIEKIYRAIDDGDIREASQEAHTLKGACANVGAVGLQDIAHKIELSINDEVSINAAALVPILEKQFIMLKGVFHENFNSRR
jgi:HPt (histidine-containing phosphotransfer) domain-containing protein